MPGPETNYASGRCKNSSAVTSDFESSNSKLCGGIDFDRPHSANFKLLTKERTKVSVALCLQKDLLQINRSARY